MILSQAVSQFLSHCRYDRNLNPKTLKAYATDLRQMSEFLVARGVGSVAEVDRGVLRGYIQHLHGLLAPRSLKRKVATMKSLFQFLEREDSIPVSPFRKMDVRIREARRLPRTIPLEELTRLFRHIYQAYQSAKGTRRGENLVRDIAVIETLFATGARVGEICHLTPSDIDLDRGCVRIFGKGSRERIVQLFHAETIEVLRLYASQKRNSGVQWFFSNRGGRRLSEQSVRSMLRAHASSAGVRLHLTPHMIRHSVATLLHEDGADIRYIQHLLGHRSISTTQMYTEVGESSQRRMLLHHHPRQRVRVQP